jgi:hypothetical protein
VSADLLCDRVSVIGIVARPRTSKSRRDLPPELAAAPIDDEPLTQDEEEAIARTPAELARGEGVADEDLDRALGWR